MLFLAGCSGAGRDTQPPVVIHERTAECEGTPPAPGGDPYESVLARARCDHPDMLVHPRWYLVRRVPSRPNVARFTLDQANAGTTECCYEIVGTGSARRVP